MLRERHLSVHMSQEHHYYGCHSGDMGTWTCLILEGRKLGVMVLASAFPAAFAAIVFSGTSLSSASQSCLPTFWGLRFVQAGLSLWSSGSAKGRRVGGAASIESPLEPRFLSPKVVCCLGAELMRDRSELETPCRLARYLHK